MNAPHVAESAATRPMVWPLSVEAYHALGEMGLIPERTELLYGEVYHKMPKSPLHSFLSEQLEEMVRGAVPSGWHVRGEEPLTCPGSEPEPDLAVVKGRREDYRDAHPTTAELVVEVCVTSHEYDRSKLRAYAGAGVKECWLVLGPQKQIEVHRQPAGDHYAEHHTFGSDETVSSTGLPMVSVILGRLFQS